VRVHVDIRKLQESSESMSCFACETPVVCVEPKQNTNIWYCAACGVFHETTLEGVRLRSFKKEESQIINLPEVKDGPIGT